MEEIKKRSLQDYLSEWDRKIELSKIDKTWKMRLRDRISQYSETLQKFGNDFEDLCKDISWNLDYFLQKEQEGGYNLKQNYSVTYGICDVCNRPLYSHRKSWNHCLLCDNNYDECNECFEKKKEEKVPHPHKMIEMVFGLYEKSSYGQRNILSFDGGGIRGYMTILMFEEYCKKAYKVEKNVNNPTKDQLDEFVKELLRKKFHLICGTSIGGIIAIMFALEINLSVIKSMFENRAKEIFVKNWFWKINTSKYQNQGIQNIYYDTIRKHTKLQNPEKLTFEDLALPCAVTTYDIHTEKILWFTSQVIEFRKLKLIDAILATSAAPTYFPIHRVYYHENKYFDCVDGGVWGNDPRLFGLFTERVMVANLDRVNSNNYIYNIISFGTGEENNDDDTTLWSMIKRMIQSRPIDWLIGSPNIIDVVYQGSLSLMQKIFRSSSIGWLIGSPNIIDVIFQGSTSMIQTIVPYMAIIGPIREVKFQLFLDSPIKLDDVNSQKQQREQFEKNLKGKFFKQWLKTAISITWVMGVKGDEKYVPIKLAQFERC